MSNLWNTVRRSIWRGKEPETTPAAPQARLSESDLKTALERPCQPFTVGGFRPTNSPTASVFGGIRVAPAGTPWPTHDGNLMLDGEGHIFASDYACVLGSDAGGLSSAIEVAPFKLTNEYLKIMGGPKSTCYQFFCSMLVSGLKRARDDAATAIRLLRLVPGNQHSKQCNIAERYLRQKLMLDATEESTDKRMRLAIDQSQRHLLTSAFDALSKSKIVIGAVEV